MKPQLITVGEPAGIGPDCIIRAWQQSPAQFSNAVIAAPAAWLSQRAELIGIDLPVERYCSFSAATSAGSSALRCWNPLPPETAIGPVRQGDTSPATAEAVIGCIEAAALACLTGDAAALVTGPIEKAVLRDAGFSFPGHTEFLAHLASAHTGKQMEFVMMLASDELRVALLTTHMALRDVPDLLSREATLACLRIVHHDLKHRFGIARPRLGLCGLNPHAGEQGHFGREEIDILEPAAKAARSEGIEVSPPLPADTLFSPNMRRQFDAVLCCYHDQALIPIKALSFGQSVNVTLGLPFIRTSVDHGTALTLAGTDKVACDSLLAAMGMATRMAEGGAAI